MKKQKPILFSTEMVRAILDGRKTQTRRIVKPQPLKNLAGNYTFGRYNEFACGDSGGNISSIDLCPYGKVGDLLYVRESMYLDTNEIWRYKADDAALEISIFNEEKTKALSEWVWNKKGSHCPSIHMPKAAARLWLEVTDVQVERLQDIRWGQAVKEGIYEASSNGYWWDYEEKTYSADFPIDSFRSLWQSINAERASWEANPWVWAVTFEPTQNPKLKTQNS